MIPSIEVHITDPTHTSEARRAALRLSKTLGFEETAQANLGLVVTEIATNVVKHARSGKIFLTPLRYVNRSGIDVFGVDSGPGMASFTECLRDGYTTAGSPGAGLGAITRQSGEYDVFTAPLKGTVIRARCMSDKAPPPVVARFDVAGITLPYPGLTESGDAWAFRDDASGSAVLVVDGLGHGELAAEAANAAVAVFHARADLSGERMMEQIDRALRHTRGAAAALVELYPGDSKVSFLGVGNISGSIANGTSSQHMVSVNGIVGHRMGKLKQFDYSWPAGAPLILHSDGLRSRWRLEDYPGLQSKSPALIAGVLMRDAGRGTDDATVVVARARSSNRG